MKRRDFLHTVAAGGGALTLGTFNPLAARAAEMSPVEETAKASAAIREQVIDALTGVDAQVDAVTLYGVHVDALLKFSYTTQPNRQHAFIRISAGGHDGWAEYNFGYHKQHPQISIGDRARSMHWFHELQGRTVGEALRLLLTKRDACSSASLECAEIALLDLAGKLAGRPTTELLGLTQTEPVPGLYCILNDDPQVVAQQARQAHTQSLRSHLKVKLYGKPEIDLAVVKAARGVMGPEAYIVGDVNYGYRRELSDESIAPLAKTLISLNQVGLSACEDPAALSPAQWAELQLAVGDLDLAPDVPLRPVWKAAAQVNADMGRVFNMHPACMGSMIDTVALGRMIQSWGKRLMVGDAGLVGPGCPPWQQLAIGLGADWVEAIEKPHNNTLFTECQTASAIGRTEEGRFEVVKRLPGFGSTLDTDRLRDAAYSVYEA